MNHDEVAFLLAVGYSLSEIMRMAADRAQGAAEGAQGAAEGAQGAAEGTQGAQGAEGAQGAQGAAEGAQGAAEGIENLRQENEKLKKQIQDLNRKNAVFEQAKEKTLDEILFQIMEEYK